MWGFFNKRKQVFSKIQHSSTEIRSNCREGSISCLAEKSSHLHNAGRNLELVLYSQEQ